MPTITWQIYLEDGRHLIILDHDQRLDKCDVHVDGQVVVYLRPQVVGTSSEHHFFWGRYRYTIIIQKPTDRRTQYAYTLHVDGSIFDPISADYTRDQSSALQGCLMGVITACINLLRREWGQIKTRYKMPAWAWWFVLACAEIHLIGWKGIWTFLPAMAGVMGCAIIGIVPSLSTFEKISGCVLITFIMWALYFAVGPML